MKHLLPLTALATLMAGLACAPKKLPEPEPRISVQVKANLEDATLTLKGQPIGKAPQRIKVHTTADLMNLVAARGAEQAVEKRIRIVDMDEVEVTFLFGEGASAMAKVLGLPKILVFDYGAGFAFDIGKSTVKPMFLPLLDRQSELLKGNFAGMDVYVCGHTDSSGKKETNMNLSMARAQAVTDELIKRGVAKEKFKVQGFADDYPVAKNDTPDGRALNRRTEVILPQ